MLQAAPVYASAEAADGGNGVAVAAPGSTGPGLDAAAAQSRGEVPATDHAAAQDEVSVQAPVDDDVVAASILAQLPPGTNLEALMRARTPTPAAATYGSQGAPASGRAGKHGRKNGDLVRHSGVTVAVARTPAQCYAEAAPTVSALAFANLMSARHQRVAHAQ